MNKNDLQKLEDISGIYEQAKEEAKELAMLQWKIKNPEAKRTPWFDEPYFEDGVFVFEGEIDYCSCCSGDPVSVSIDLWDLADGSNWKERLQKKLDDRAEKERLRKELEQQKKEKADAEKRRQEYLELRKEFGDIEDLK